MRSGQGPNNDPNREGLCPSLFKAPAPVDQPAADLAAAPSLVMVSGIDKAKGQIAFTDACVIMVPVSTIIKEKVVEKLPGGNEQEKEVTKVVTKYVQEFKQQTFKLDLAKIKVITADGKPLLMDELWQRVKPNTVVAISETGKAPQQGYLQVLKADTIVLILDAPLMGDPLPAPPQTPPKKAPEKVIPPGPPPPPNLKVMPGGVSWRTIPG